MGQTRGEKTYSLSGYRNAIAKGQIFTGRFIALLLIHFFLPLQCLIRLPVNDSKVNGRKGAVPIIPPRKKIWIDEFY